MAIVLLTFATLLPASAAADTIHVTTGTDFSPFTDKHMEGGGIFTQIVGLIIKEMGHEMKVDWLPWKRGYMGTQSATYMATFPYNPSEKRKKDFLFSDPVLTYEVLHFVLQDSKFQTATSYEGMRDRRLCLPLGYANNNQALVDQGILKLVTSKSLDLCLKMILADRADFVQLNPFVGWQMVIKTFGDRSKFRTIRRYQGETATPKSTNHVIVSKTAKGGAEFLAEFNKQLQKIKDNGMLDKVIAPYRP